MGSCADCGSSTILCSLLVVPAVSEGGPQHNHEEDKLKPHFYLCKQENNRRGIKGADEHAKSSMILIWSQMKTIVEAQHSIVPIL